MTRKYTDRNPVDEIKRAYSLFVADDPSGKISLRALRKIAKDLNNNLTDEELQAMIDEFDYDQDGYSGLISQRKRIHPDYVVAFL